MIKQASSLIPMGETTEGEPEFPVLLVSQKPSTDSWHAACPMLYYIGGFPFMKERTLSIIKPDGVARGIIGEVIQRIEEAGLNILAMKMIRMTSAEAKGFYKVHEGKPFYASLTDFMSSGPCVVMVLEGDNAITEYRQLMGATDYTKAEEGTIRRAFATDIEKNVVHGSDSESSADFEINYFFSELEIIEE
jgi:nucleoside-diphosphate kinase